VFAQGVSTAGSMARELDSRDDHQGDGRAAHRSLVPIPITDVHTHGGGVLPLLRSLTIHLRPATYLEVGTPLHVVCRKRSGTA
jgi:hypothetical protein